jgi:outer membrane biosynthesis protein TonB
MKSVTGSGKAFTFQVPQDWTVRHMGSAVAAWGPDRQITVACAASPKEHETLDAFAAEMVEHWTETVPGWQETGRKVLQEEGTQCLLVASKAKQGETPTVSTSYLFLTRTHQVTFSVSCPKAQAEERFPVFRRIAKTLRLGPEPTVAQAEPAPKKAQEPPAPVPQPQPEPQAPQPKAAPKPPEPKPEAQPPPEPKKTPAPQPQTGLFPDAEGETDLEAAPPSEPPKLKRYHDRGGVFSFLAPATWKARVFGMGVVVSSGDMLSTISVSRSPKLVLNLTQFAESSLRTVRRVSPAWEEKGRKAIRVADRPAIYVRAEFQKRGEIILSDYVFLESERFQFMVMCGAPRDDYVRLKGAFAKCIRSLEVGSRSHEPMLPLE